MGWDGGLLVVLFTRLVNLRVNHRNVHKLATDFVKYFMMKNNHSYFINIKSCTKDSLIQSLRISLLFNERTIKHFHPLYQYNSSKLNYKAWKPMTRMQICYNQKKKTAKNPVLEIKHSSKKILGDLFPL